MNDLFNTQIEPAIIYNQPQGVTQGGLAPPSVSFGTSFTSINGIAGPNLTLDGGTTGYSFSPSGGTLTLSGPLTTKGDLYTRDSTSGTRLPVGTDGTFLVADSGQATGLKWLAGQIGWTAWTGTQDRSTHATYSGTASVAYVQAEMQGVMDKLQETTEALKAVIDDLLTLKAIKT